MEDAMEITNRDPWDRCIICSTPQCACGGPTTSVPVDADLEEPNQ